MPDRSRLLLIGPSVGPLDSALAAAADVEPVSNDPSEVARRLKDGGFSAVVASPDVVAGLLDRFRRDELIIGHIETGLAVLDHSGIVLWANPVFRDLADGDPIGKFILSALGVLLAAVEVVARPDAPVHVDEHSEWTVPSGSRLADPLAPAARGWGHYYAFTASTPPIDRIWRSTSAPSLPPITPSPV